jgi:nucleoside-diphosphate-sugar epimerase
VVNSHEGPLPDGARRIHCDRTEPGGFAALSLVHVNDVARLMASLIGNERVKGEAYNVSGSEITSIVGVVHLAARAMGMKASVIEAPMEIARRQRPPLMHWGEGVAGTAVLSIDKALLAEIGR